MLAALLLVSVGSAGSLTAPIVSEAFPGDCDQSVAIRAGDPLHSPIVGSDGLAACNAVAMPPAQVAYLLKLEEYHHARERLHALDVELLQTERNWYRDELATQSQPVPWYQTTTAARWGGRLEVLAVVAILGAGMGYYVHR